jgi:hypothetical protein
MVIAIVGERESFYLKATMMGDAETDNVPSLTVL